MNDIIINNWNGKVRQGDVVYHLGDFSFGNGEYIQQIRKRLNGRIVLIRGNHDIKPGALRNCGVNVENELRFNLAGFELYLRHRPVYDTIKWRGADYHLVGHIHNKWKRINRIINVGVDVWNFAPISLDELSAELY